MVRLVMTLTLLTLVVAPDSARAMGGEMFEEVSCSVLAEGRSVAMSFRDSERRRRLVIIRPYRELLIERPENLEKGSIGWKNVKSIELQRENGKEVGFLVVNLKPGTSWPGLGIVEFGQLTDNCWDEIRTRFGNDLQFVESVKD